LIVYILFTYAVVISFSCCFVAMTRLKIIILFAFFWSQAEAGCPCVYSPDDGEVTCDPGTQVWHNKFFFLCLYDKNMSIRSLNIRMNIEHTSSIMLIKYWCQAQTTDVSLLLDILFCFVNWSMQAIILFFLGIILS